MKPLESTSKIIKITNSDERIFNFLSDFNNYKRIASSHQLPQEFADIELESITDCSCTLKIKGQLVCIKIIEKVAFNTIKFESDLPGMKFNMWIQMKNLSAYETAARVTIHADINMLLRPMLKGKLQDGVDKIAETLKILPY